MESDAADNADIDGLLVETTFAAVTIDCLLVGVSGRIELCIVLTGTSGVSILVAIEGEVSKFVATSCVGGVRENNTQLKYLCKCICKSFAAINCGSFETGIEHA